MSERSSHPRRMALIPISLEILRLQILRMPKDTVIESAVVDPHRPDLIYLRVRHPALPEVGLGERLREISLVIHDDGRESEFQQS